MKVETLLPLGKVDPGLRAPATPLNISSVYDDARTVEDLGYDGLVVEEIKDDPFMIVALAAQATRRLNLGTAIALAFPRSPTVTAMSAWTAQKLSRGRFTLGLGTQVRAHIERRYGIKWSAPGPWMREYVQAVRAVWKCWQEGSPLNFQGKHYTLNLVVPLFNPGPIDHPDIPIHLAAVNARMCSVAGEVADGLRPHPVCTPKYIEEVMLPAARAGAARVGRRLDNFSVCIKPLIATAPDAASLQEKIRDVRARVAFYASTPSYLPAFEIHGLTDLANKLKILAREQRWEEMPTYIPDGVLNTYATVATFDEIGAKLKERYGHLVTNAEFSIPVRNESDRAKLERLIATLRSAV
jgi:probable F420-dependent oxidoreductase